MDNQKFKSTIALFPLGTTDTRSFDKRGPWTLNHPEKVIEKSMNDGELLIDYEHQSSHASHNGKPAPAAGWIVSMHVSTHSSHFPHGAILANVVWTEKAFLMIQNSEYRFISPTFLTDNKGEVTQIISAALVNQPAITSLPPLKQKTENENASYSLSSSFKRYFRTQPQTPSPIHSLTLTLPSEKSPPDNKKSAHTLLKNALQNGLITPAQRPWAELCANKASHEFAEFLAASPPPSQDLSQSVTAQKMTPKENHNTDHDIIRILGINPQHYLQIQQKEASS